MCKPRTQSSEPHRSTEERAYEGETVRLDPNQAPAMGRTMQWRRGGFPWWSLWLIWPLFGLIKWLVVAAAGLVTNVAGALPEPALFTLWPVALIVIGLVLLRRK